MKLVKKILVVGKFSLNSNIYTYASSFYKTFLKLGYEVEKFNLIQRFSNKRLSNFLFNYLLQKKVAKFKPDLVFLIKAENIYFKTLKNIKTKFNTLLVNFYPDNPFVFWNGNSNSDVLKSLPLYDCFLIWSKMLMPLLETAGCKNVFYFPFAYESELFDWGNLNVGKYENGVCFIGTWEIEREKWLTQICEKSPNLKLAIWGNMWDENLSKNSILRNFFKGRAIYAREMIKEFQASKIVLNFIRRQNFTSHNMKTFEIPASGSFMLTQRTDEQANFLFKEDENIECFDNIDELIDKIKIYLINDKLRKSIAKKSFENVQKYQIDNVLKNFMEYFITMKANLSDEALAKSEERGIK